MKAYQAYSSIHGNVTADTAKQAALLFFEKFPKARKCNIVQGTTDGRFFTVTYGRASTGEWPESYKDITRKTIDTIKGDQS